MKSFKLLPLLMALALAGCGEKAPAPAAAAPEAAAPVASAAVAEPAAPAAAAEPAAPVAAVSAADLAKGEQIYNSTCMSCHGAGVLGAPKVGDKALWEPRIAQGKETLYTHAIDGIRMMPPRGGNAALSDGEVKAAVDYMVSKES